MLKSRFKGKISKEVGEKIISAKEQQKDFHFRKPQRKHWNIKPMVGKRKTMLMMRSEINEFKTIFKERGPPKLRINSFKKMKLINI